MVGQILRGTLERWEVVGFWLNKKKPLSRTYIGEHGKIILIDSESTSGVLHAKRQKVGWKSGLRGNYSISQEESPKDSIFVHLSSHHMDQQAVTGDLSSSKNNEYKRLRLRDNLVSWVVGNCQADVFMRNKEAYRFIKVPFLWHHVLHLIYTEINSQIYSLYSPKWAA